MLFKLDPKHTDLSVGGSSPTARFRVAANPYVTKGKHHGVAIRYGSMHPGVLTTLPILVVHDDNSVGIYENVDIATLARARYAFSGSSLLIKDGVSLEPKSPLKLDVYEDIPRIAFGILPDGHILVIEGRYTISAIQLLLLDLGVYDAILGASGNTFIDYPDGGIMSMSAAVVPVTVLEATKVTSLEHPVVVFDAGHGGKDPGALGNNLKESALNLELTLKVISKLRKSYIGSFLTTRKDDTTIELNDRAPLALKVHPHAFISFHVNAAESKEAHGFETFTQPGAGAKSLALQKSVHTDVMKFLNIFGVTDRGAKQKNLAVLRGTTGKGTNACASMLFESLFITHAGNASLLASKEWMERYSDVVADAIAKALALKPKTAPPPTTKLFRVQVGAYESRPNAEAVQKQLQGLGYNAIVVQDK